MSVFMIRYDRPIATLRLFMNPKDILNRANVPLDRRVTRRFYASIWRKEYRAPKTFWAQTIHQKFTLSSIVFTLGQSSELRLGGEGERNPRVFNGPSTEHSSGHYQSAADIRPSNTCKKWPTFQDRGDWALASRCGCVDVPGNRPLGTYQWSLEEFDIALSDIHNHPPMHVSTYHGISQRPTNRAADVAFHTQAAMYPI